LGYKKIIVFTITTLLFFTTSILVNKQGETIQTDKAKSLKLVLKNIGGWKFVENIPLDLSIQNELKLNDYLFARYAKNNEHVTLYIGYYYSKMNIGAAHDPLVCFPGQGWKLSDRKRGQIELPNLGQKINYSSMVAQRGESKEQLLYWFQASEFAVADTLQQKIASFKSTLQGKKGESAFVRISCSQQDGKSNCTTALREFATSFYPHFLEYITNY